MKTKVWGAKQLLVITMLLFSVNALAVDTDGDGVDDSVDAFPNNAEATVDTDGDGLPDTIDYSKVPVVFYEPFSGSFQSGWTVGPQWSVVSTYAKHVSGYSVRSGGLRRSFDVSGSARLTFLHHSDVNDSNSNGALYYDNGLKISFLFSTVSWKVETLLINSGTHTLEWGYNCQSLTGCPFSPVGYVDDVELRQSALILDLDDDNDGVLDTSDKFPLDTTESVDTDNDGIGNNADTDDDNDTVLDVSDNCPLNSNLDQLNTDGDALGDVCDSDDDNDGVIDASDKFPLNAAASSDADNDGFPGSWNAVCDITCQINSGLALDNCPTIANASQLDTDGDTQGDICDNDDDNDGVLDVFDNCALISNTDQLNSDGDVYGDVCDVEPYVVNPGSLDSTFNPNLSTNGAVYTTVVQADGKIIIGGYFNSVNGIARSKIARLNADGSLDGSFNPGSGANCNVYATAVQADGKILAGGCFYSYNGTTINRIARLNADGSVDSSFNLGSGSNGTINTIAVQADGKIIIGGDFSSINGVARSCIARLNSDGSLDVVFNPGVANYIVNVASVQSDDKILIGGLFSNYIARLKVDGSNDNYYSSGLNDEVNTIAIQTDGKILIGGNFYSPRSRIARLNIDGSPDASFNAGTSNTVETIAVQADGKILVGGWFTSMNGTQINRLSRLNADGSLDSSFNPGSGVNNTVYTMAVQVDGSIVIGGSFTMINGVARSYIARIHSGDADSDGIEDAADTNNNPDTDADGVNNLSDNCPLIANADQLNTDADAQGDACDSDDDNDGISDVWETAYGLNPLLNDASDDIDGDGITNLQEYLNGSNPTTKPVVNDFASDGKADLLLRNTTTGDWSLAQLNGLTVLNQSTVGAFSDIENVIVSTGDFDGDGDADILTRGTDNGLFPGAFHIDLTNGATVTGSAWLFTLSIDTNDEVMSTKDFNKDGKADVLLRNKTTGVWKINYMNGSSDPTTATLNASTDLCYTLKGDGDYDSNGYPDLLLRKDACGGASYPWLINTTDGDTTILASGTATGVSMNATWVAVVTDKDFNGDGKADVLMRAQAGSVQQWLLYDMNGAGAPSASGLLNIPVQSMWQFASEADLNGDGNTDVLLRSTDTGQWYADLLNGRTILSAGTVNVAMNPVWALQATEDNNGDGKGDILLRNNASGQWHLNLMNGLTVQSSSALSITTDLNYTLQND